MNDRNSHLDRRNEGNIEKDCALWKVKVEKNVPKPEKMIIK